jgi:hypothetical protein
MKLEDKLKIPVECFELGLALPSSDFSSYQNLIVDKVCESSDVSYQACRDWGNDRFTASAEKLVTAVTQEARTSWYAIAYLGNDRFNPFASQFFDGVEKDDNFSSRIVSWPFERVHMRVLYKCGGVNEHLPILAEAYGNCGGQWSKFRAGLKQVKPEDQGKWAEYIIEEMKPKGIGGGNYREVTI